jgi:hypothetical protein
MINKKIITTLAILLFNLSAINVAYAAKIGELNFGSKAKYIGEVKNGKAHGIGALKTIDGTNYIGKFKRNIVNGEGILIKLHANDKLADLNISKNFPQLNKNEIQVALTDFRESWVNLREVKDQITDQDEGFFTKLKVQRQNLKKEFFESTYPEWWKDVLKKTNNDEKLLLEGIQIFVGKWKYGTHTEYLDKDKNFRRQTKLKKLTKIAEDEKKEDEDEIGDDQIAEDEKKEDEDEIEDDEVVKKPVLEFVIDLPEDIGAADLIARNKKKKAFELYKDIPGNGGKTFEDFLTSLKEDDKKEDDKKPAERSKTYPNGSTFTGTFDDRGLPSTGTWSNFEGKNFAYKNGQKIGEVGAEAEEVNSKPAAAQAKIDRVNAALDLAAAIANRARRSSVDHSMQQKFGKAYYDVTLSSGDPAVLDFASLSNEVAKAVKAGKKNKGKKNKNKRKKLKLKEKKLKQKAIKLEKQLSKAKTEKKRAKLEKKRAKLEKQLNKLGLDDLNEVLGLSDQGDDQASIGGGAPSIEISKEGQSQMDADTASAAAAGSNGADGADGAGGDDGGGDGGGGS